MTTQNHFINLAKAVERMRVDIDPYVTVSDYLNARSSWRRSVVLGIASIFDFTGQLAPRYRMIRDPAEEDASALNGDWLAIREDFRRIMAAASTLDLNGQSTDRSIERQG